MIYVLSANSVYLYNIQSETIDCGEHTVTITELDDAYSAVQDLGVDAECDNSNEDDMDFGDSAGITNETQTIAGGSVSDQRKVLEPLCSLF